MKTAKNSLWEVIAGIWVLAAVVILALVFWVPNPLACALGEVVGSLVSTLLMLHLYRCLDVELDLPEKRAISHSRFHTILRSLIELAVLFGSFYVARWIFPYTVFTGLLGRKIAALLVPVIERYRFRNSESEDKI